MTMKDFYMLTISEAKELKTKVESEGIFVREVFNEEFFNHHKIYIYNGNEFEVNSFHGIVNIK